MKNSEKKDIQSHSRNTVLSAVATHNNNNKKNNMEFKGTKGKWYRNTKSKIVSSVYSENEEKLIHISGKNNEEAQANALLISKAPEVIAKLKESTDILKSVLFLFENEMAFSTRFGVKTQIEENENLIKEATEL